MRVATDERHFFANLLVFWSKILEIIMILSDFFQFGVFLLQIFFLATELSSSDAELARATKRKKKL